MGVKIKEPEHNQLELQATTDIGFMKIKSAINCLNAQLTKKEQKLEIVYEQRTVGECRIVHIQYYRNQDPFLLGCIYAKMY